MVFVLLWSITIVDSNWCGESLCSHGFRSSTTLSPLPRPFHTARFAAREPPRRLRISSSTPPEPYLALFGILVRPMCYSGTLQTASSSKSHCHEVSEVLRAQPFGVPPLYLAVISYMRSSRRPYPDQSDPWSRHNPSISQAISERANRNLLYKIRNSIG